MLKSLLFISLLFLCSRLVNVLLLPVFADEAIYIRWSQMITDDPKQYLFLPLYDGKSPLFMWVLVPFLQLFNDPLLASRSVSVLFGFVNLIIFSKIVKACKGTKRAQVFSALLSIALPFTLFFDRMGLIDTMLTTFLAISFWFLVEWKNRNFHGFCILGSGIFWGLALMTKTSGLYYVLVPLAYFCWYYVNTTEFRKPSIVFPFIAAGIIGLGFLGWMRVSPLFPFLFNRSSDFAFTPLEIITQLPHILSLNFYRIGKWLWVYLTPGVWLIVISLFLLKSSKYKMTILGLLSCCLLFLIPFLLTGKLLSSRYFLPVVIWLIPVVSLALDELLKKHYKLGAVGGFLTILFCARFAFPLLTNPGQTPLAHEDDVQYLTEWSSGYGIPEVRDFLRQEAQTKRVIVATEGYFGTLPDGLFMYFNGSPLQQNLEIFGVGQPINGINDNIKEKTKEGDVYLLVNKHRLMMNELPPNMRLIASYPRPKNGPPLQLYRIYPE